MRFYNMNDEEVQSFKQKKFYKVLNTNECHHRFQYKEGLNIDTNRFYPGGNCSPGGMYFTDFEHIILFLDYGNHLREVTFPENAQIYQEEDKWKADRFILGPKLPFTLDVFGQIFFRFPHQIYYVNELLIFACGHGDLELTKFSIENGGDIHYDREYPVQKAVICGRLNIIKFLVEQGTDIHSDNDFALRKAKELNRIEIVKYIESLP